MGKWSSLFFEGNPIIVLMLFVLSLFIIFHIMKATFRLVIPVLLFGFILSAVFGYSPNELLKQGREFASLTTAYVENTLKPAISKGLAGEDPAKYLNRMDQLLQQLRNKLIDS